MDDARRTAIDAREEPEDGRPDDQEAVVSNQQIFEALARIAQGDLSFRINGVLPELAGDGRQLLVNLDGLARRLRYIVGRLQRAADSIETVVGEVLRGTQAVSAGVIAPADAAPPTIVTLKWPRTSSIGLAIATLLLPA